PLLAIACQRRHVASSASIAGLYLFRFPAYRHTAAPPITDAAHTAFGGPPLRVCSSTVPIMRAPNPGASCALPDTHHWRGTNIQPGKQKERIRTLRPHDTVALLGTDNSPSLVDA